MTAVVNAVGWALLHFVWQGALVAAIFTVAVRLLRTPEARYALGVGAMFAMLALPVVTATRYGPSADRATQRSASPANTAGPSVASPSPTTQTETVESASAAAVRGSHAVSESDVVAGARTPWDRLTSAFAPLANSLPLLVACWLTGVFILSLRLFDAWLHARRLTREGTRPAPEAHRQMLQRLAGRLRIWRPVTIVESTLLRVPAVVGWLRPIVLLPAVALTGLTAQQVEALIAHELAHVKRHDFLANIIQSAIETLLFYHPAVWYVSRRVREEREHCCDDIAMGICGNPDEYARALLRVAEGSVGAPALVTAATGGPGTETRAPAAAVYYAGREPYVQEPMAGLTKDRVVALPYGTATAASSGLVAVRLPATEVKDFRPVAGDRILVVAPPSATKLRVAADTVPLTNGVGFLTTPAPVAELTLTALDATGATVATGRYREPDTTGQFFGEGLVDDWRA